MAILFDSILIEISKFPKWVNIDSKPVPINSTTFAEVDNEISSNEWKPIADLCIQSPIYSEYIQQN